MYVVGVRNVLNLEISCSHTRTATNPTTIKPSHKYECAGDIHYKDHVITSLLVKSDDPAFRITILKSSFSSISFADTSQDSTFPFVIFSLSIQSASVAALKVAEDSAGA